MLRVALPNKGSLSDPAITMLREAGYRTRREGGRELVIRDQENGIDFFYLRPRDIAVYVGQGTVDAGITGRDLLKDSGTTARERLPLGFGHSTFRFAAPVGSANGERDISGKRVATSYDILVDTHLKEQGVDATVVHLDGAVESSIELGVADVVADVVETGSTLRAAGLEVFGEPILHSEAVLIVPSERPEDPQVDVLERRIKGVIVARQYVLMDFDIPAEHLDQAVAIAPGFESPTVSPLHDGDWVAVRVMIERDRINSIMDRLYEIGARAILVTSIHACRI
ncbi:MAG TPA: ATP phosphoribosyltransferase [Actinomycetales bacterium]|nr:ATP phosphoribosyltransferase [Actinomycetales bacterium]